MSKKSTYITDKSLKTQTITAIVMIILPLIIVAAEVRKLAEKCATSARDIDLVSNQGKQVAKQTCEAFSQVLPEIERTTQLVKEIAISSSEQAANSNHINLGVQNFNSSTQHVAALSEEVATNCQSLAEMADALTRMIQFFKL